MLWRRLAAAAIDGMLFLVAASLASIAIYSASGGVVRAFTFMPVTRCEPMAEAPASVVRAAEAALSVTASQATEATSCRRSFLGLETGRFVLVSLHAQQGETVIGANVFQPVDRSGAPIQPVTLDWLYPLVFVLLLSALEGFWGETPGKSAMALRVVRADGGRPGLPRALTRNLIVYGWLVAWLLWRFALPHLAQRLPPTRESLVLLQYAGPALAAALALGALGLLALGAYDRWTGTRVVRA